MVEEDDEDDYDMEDYDKDCISLENRAGLNSGSKSWAHADYSI